MVKNLPAMQEAGFDPWVGKIPWRREWLPTPVFLPQEFHGQRSLVAYSPRDHKESDTTEQLTVSPCFFFFSLQEGNGNPLQYFCLENSMDEGAWWVTVHGVTKSQTRLSNFMMMALLNAPHACVFSCGWLLATPWMIACEAPLSMEFPLQERWSSCHSQLQGIFPMEGSNPHVQSLLYCRQIP